MIDPSERLAGIVSQLSDIQKEILVEVALAMGREVAETSDPSSDIATEPFRTSFRNRLLLHHATNEAKLSKKAFEFAFKRASQDAGRNAEITSSDTFPGADVIVDEIAFSLKTEASKGINMKRSTISKFSEARWIQQCSTVNELAVNTVKRIPEHLKRYERIIMLRAIGLESTKILYQLVEIPIDVLLLVRKLKVSDFTNYTSQGGSSAAVRKGKRTAFTLRLDGSDGKITISGLDLSICKIHAAWAIPLGVPSDGSE